MKGITSNFIYKNIAILTLFCFTCFFISAPLDSKAKAFDYDYKAESIYLLEAETGKVLYEKNAKQPNAPASLTKIMTLVLGLEALDEGKIQWDEKTTISNNARIPLDGTQSVMGFDRKGEQVKISDILTGIAVVSANDGCIALAEHISGSERSFVNSMNEKAEEIGMENTNFKNSHGLDHENQYMSAEDVGILAKYAVNETPKILELESLQEFTFNDITQPNRNLLLPGKSYEYEGTDGLKTGETKEAGASFVGTAKRNDMRLIAVIMNAPDRSTRFIEARNLLNFGFNNFNKFTLFNKEEKIGEALVAQGTERTVPLAVSNELKVVTQINDPDELEQELKYDDEIKAPLEKGETIGELKIYENKEVIASVNLEAAETVNELGFLGKILRSITVFFSNIWNTILEWLSNLI